MSDAIKPTQCKTDLRERCEHGQQERFEKRQEKCKWKRRGR